MPCNYSGYTNPAIIKGFGLVDFDWSNARLDWSNAKPMDCQERLVTQASMVKATTPYAKVMIYRNLVKALPWYSQVREKMLDPQYSGWFLKFDPNGAAGLPAGQYYSPRCTKEALGVKCSPFYHDQEQTPSVPRASSNATRTEHGAWYVYNNTNDVSALHPGYRTITNAGPAIDWTACRALADKADRKIFTWWANKVGGNGSCWLSSEWSTPPIPPNQGKLPVIEAEHVSGYKPSSSTDPAPPPLGLYDECDDGECDCGPGLPCGEYLWDHRNQSLREWLIADFLLGPDGLGNVNVDGYYVDDSWSRGAGKNFDPTTWNSCSNGAIGGATEEEKHCSIDMGLTAQDVADITGNWSLTKAQAKAAVLANKGFLWGSYSMFVGTGARVAGNGIAPGEDPRPKCASFLREACTPNSPQQKGAFLFELTRKDFQDPFPLPFPVEDVAQFLLTRGPYAWLGHNWMGCFAGGLTPPGSHPLPEDPAILRPKELDVDYGAPTEGTCKETALNSGIFTRDYTKVRVEMNCNTWVGSLKMK